MATSFHTPLTTKNSFIKTIHTDRLVFRWFLFLMLTPAVKDGILKESNNHTTYRQMKSFLLMHKIFILCVLLGIMAYMLWPSSVLILGVGVLFILSILIEARLRYKIADLAYTLMGQFYNEAEFQQNTLYMLCERLASEYQVESLIYGVATIDNVIRRILIFAVFLVVFIQLMSFWKGLFTLFVLYYIGTVIVNTSMVYKALMK